MVVGCASSPNPSPMVDVTVTPLVSPTPVPTATPVPTQTPVPTSTPRPTPTNTPLPWFLFPDPLPLLGLKLQDRVYPGFRGSSVWPAYTQGGRIISWTQGDAIPPNPPFTISYNSGDTLTVEVTANHPPTSLEVQVGLDHGGKTLTPPFPPLVIEPFEFEPGVTSEFNLDLPEGTFMVTVTGGWEDVGGISYAWRFEVE